MTRAALGLLCLSLAALPAAAALDGDQERELERLLALADEAARLNAATLPWFLAGGRDGLHFEDYLARVAEVERELETPASREELAPIAALLAQSVGSQRGFFADWREALREGRSFESQLTSELGYHAELHRSQRVLVEAWGRLVLLVGDAAEAQQRGWLARLCSLDLLCGPRR